MADRDGSDGEEQCGPGANRASAGHGRGRLDAVGSVRLEQQRVRPEADQIRGDGGELGDEGDDKGAGEVRQLQPVGDVHARAEQVGADDRADGG